LVRQDYEIIADFEGYTIQEAKLEYAARQDLPASAFCGPNRSYPSHDAAHVRNGLARISQFGSKMKPKVRARIEGCLKSRARRFGVEVTETKVDRTPLINWYLQECGIDNNNKKVK
jgi:hypothetical protein